MKPVLIEKIYYFSENDSRALLTIYIQKKEYDITRVHVQDESFFNDIELFAKSEIEKL